MQPFDEEQDGTRVDLGEDLLQSSAPTEKKPKETSIEDEFHSAKILKNEGFLDDAKKVLRKILRDRVDFRPAQKLLEEIQQIELKEYLRTDHGEPDRRRVSSQESLSAQKMIQILERELEIPPELEGSTAEVEQALAGLENLDAQDHIDLGIAAMEMEIFTSAVHQFESAEQKLSKNQVGRLRAIALKVYALIQAEEFLKAVLDIEFILSDLEIENSEKVEFLYLMGRAQEGLGRANLAKKWYDKVLELAPGYRDAEWRTKR